MPGRATGPAWRIEAAFAEVARASGERAAIEIDGSVVSYGDLSRGADRLAARLARCGVGAGDVVGVACADVGQFALGTLAVLKVGAAYLSIDLRYPLERTPSAVFEGVAKLLIGDGLPQDIPADLPVMRDAFRPAEDAPAEAAPSAPRPTGRDVAYLCYTSGTTGVAKGAVIPHAGVRGLVSHPEYEALRAGARIASCSTFAFDAITFEVWGALLNGACVVQVPLDVVRSPRRLADFLGEARVDGAFLTTSLFNAVAMHRPEAFGAMTTLVVGGEAVQPTYVQRVFDSGRPPRRLLNGYGPTETTTFATCHAITPADAERGVIPIGLTIEGRQAYVLTPEGQLAGPGAEGELCIGGEAVAFGYLGAPELTAEKFVVGRAPEDPQARVYRTGDVCRMRDDGTLEYLGRIDDQVKIKGYRIEPAGVAALLGRIDGVADAVVVPRQAAFGAKQLVAFLRGDARLSEAELQAAAARLMPDYMLPSAFAWVDRFPLKATGKLDTGALLAELDARGAAAEAQAADELERKLVGIWRRNGGRANFDRDTPFDEVCDSLAMVGVMLDIEAAFGREQPQSALAPPVTIRAMAAALRGPAAAPARPVRAFFVGQPWNMNSAPEAIGAALAGPGGWRELRVPPTAASAMAYDRIEDMGAILEAQVLAAGEGGPYTLAGHSFGGLLAFELARRLERRGLGVERLVLLDSLLARRRPPLDLARVRFRQFLVNARDDPRGSWARGMRHARAALGWERANRAEQIRDRCMDAMFRYAPEPIAAPAVLIHCLRYEVASDRPGNSVFGRTLPWAPLVGGLTVADFDCTHAQVVRDQRWAEMVAAYLRAPLAARGRPEPGMSAPSLTIS
jgi:amino acid adenylation domain-containing protein